MDTDHAGLLRQVLASMNFHAQEKGTEAKADLYSTKTGQLVDLAAA